MSQALKNDTPDDGFMFISSLKQVMQICQPLKQLRAIYNDQMYPREQNKENNWNVDSNHFISV